MATRDYTLGKGKVLFKPENTEAYIDLGNAPAFAINVNIEKLEHFSSREGLSKKDLEVITKLGMGGSFTLDEPNAENLRMFLMSTTTTTAVQGSAALGAIDNIDLPAASALGKWYPFTDATAGAASAPVVTDGATNTGTAVVTSTLETYAGTNTFTYLIRVTTAGTEGVAEVQTRRSDELTWCTPFTVGLTGNPIKLAAGTDTLLNFAIDDVDLLDQFDEFSVYVEYVASATSRVYNIDTAGAATDSVTVTVGGQQMTEGIEGVGNYQVDRKAGLLYINIDQSTPTYAIADNDTLVIQVKKLAGTKTASDGGTLSTLKGDMYFIGNPPQGRVIDVMGFCSLTPNGDFSLIGEDWMQVQFNVEFLEVAGVSGLVKIEDRGKIG